MSQILQTELTLKEKLMNIVGALRNHQGIEQTTGMLFHEDKMCAMGLMAFRAGVPKEEIIAGGLNVLEKYGFTYAEADKIQLPSRPTRRWSEIQETVQEPLSFLWMYNDFGLSFDEIADVVEEKANSL
ncbi:hypothetical protein LCGC14_0586360 [marine sediment metagenome]|uniref:Uncharacterized protein n=1 Tax=marine sediment metagenome TaxID=412755 RepID=A0A0F9REV7_9ZZZZ